MSEAARAEYGRPVSIEEFSNRFLIHPLSGIVERVAIRFGISANIVSFLGLGAGLLAGVFYYYQSHTQYVIAAFLCMIAWHIFDGADGRIARATGTSSAFGRIIDGMCDHLVFGAVYIAFVLYLINTGSSQTMWLLGLAAAASHGLQAAGYEERRQKFQRRNKGVDRDSVAAKLVAVDGKKSGLASAYDFAQRIVSGGNSPLDAKLSELRGTNGPAAQTAVNKTGKIVRAWALLNANNRTIMLAVFALLGRPAWYFVYEIVLLNSVMIALLIYERRTEAAIAGSAQ